MTFKTKQYLLHGLLMGGIGVMALVVMFWIFSPSGRSSTKDVRLKNNIQTGTERINPQEVWVHKFSQEAELTQKRMETLEKTLEKLIQLNTAKETENPTKENGGEDIQEIRKEIQDKVSVDEKNPLPHLASETSSPSLLPMPPGQSVPMLSPAFRSKSLQKISIALVQNKSLIPLKTTDNTIPAGAFAKAILLGGVDASTSIQASNDPRPLLLRITDLGTLPRFFHSDLKGCHALAACYGDLSSERVFMRLEKLTCIERKTGEVLEMNVQGYVAGEDGRAGLRGMVVDRAGESMRNAMVGGFLSGMGNFISASAQPLTFSPTTGLAQTNPLTNGAMFKQGATKGVSGALERYADFYIKRAEQMQPVIQVAAGRIADIVFTQGVSMGDSALRGTVSKVNDQKRYQTLHTMGTTSLDKDLEKEPTE